MERTVKERGVMNVTFPVKMVSKGKACGEDSKILALRELVRC